MRIKGELIGMKRMNLFYVFAAVFVLSVVFLITKTAPARAEDDPAQLTFTSFAGGGPEYDVVIEVPEIVEVKKEYKYNLRKEDVDGAGYKIIFSFIGLKEGSTRIVVHGGSPIADFPDTVYNAKVDSSLHLELEKIVLFNRFVYSHQGSVEPERFDLYKSEGNYYLCTFDKCPVPVNDEIVRGMERIIGKYNVDLWDGFHRENLDVLDGESFTLQITLPEDTTIEAAGNNAFPDNYRAASNGFLDLLRIAAAGDQLRVDGTYALDDTGFEINILENGFFTFCLDGNCVGHGEWEMDSGKIVLFEISKDTVNYYYFLIGDGTLKYLQDESDQLPFVDVSDKQIFNLK